jgi:subtilisin family serine protease
MSIGTASAFAVTDALVAIDPGYTDNSQNIDRQWALPRARFIDAWNKTTGNSSVVVAFVDTGVDQAHEDFQSSTFTAGYDFVSNKQIEPGSDSDDNGHGTLVAGVLGATTNNGVGVSGTNWHITLMPLKALDASGNGTSENVAKAIMWAADHGATIINLSLGGVGFGQDATLSSAISYAFKHNLVIVAAAGNDTAPNGGDLDKDPVFPICDDNAQNMVIGVTAIDVNDQKPSFANYGKSCVDVSAPGKRILSTIGRDPVTRAKAPNSYAYASGTSLAAPYVSGQAALLKAMYPTATNAQIRDRIIATADPVDTLNLQQCAGPCSGKIGAGRINVAASLATQILPEVVAEGDVVEVAETGEVYVMSGGKRARLSSFVRQQRFGAVTPRRVYYSQIANIPEGQYAAPADGTLVKTSGSPTVYWVANGLKMPVSAAVFR